MTNPWAVPGWEHDENGSHSSDRVACRDCGDLRCGREPARGTLATGGGELRLRPIQSCTAHAAASSRVLPRGAAPRAQRYNLYAGRIQTIGAGTLRTAVRGPSYEGATNGRVYTVDSSAILDANTLHVFATNRSLSDDAPLRIVLADRSIAQVLDCEVVTGDDPKAENSFEDPDRIRAERFEEVKISAGTVEARLPPMSAVAMSFSLT